MVQVKFYNEVEDRLLKFAVIVAKSKNQWVICKHKDRETYEVPGGHREPGETILETARRELHEETGAIEYILSPICIYSVKGTDGGNQNHRGKASHREDVEGRVNVYCEENTTCGVNATHGIIDNQEETYGMLYFAEIQRFDNLPDFEMEQVILLDELPTKWTYPLIQPKLMEKVMTMI